MMIFSGIYMWLTHNYAALLSWVLFTTSVLFITFLFGSKKNNRLAIITAPAYVFLYTAITLAEIYAMFASIKLLLQNREVKWQTWSRKGIENAVPE